MLKDLDLGLSVCENDPWGLPEVLVLRTAAQVSSGELVLIGFSMLADHRGKEVNTQNILNR